jgi:methionine biosynthesis protein MetW
LTNQTREVEQRVISSWINWNASVLDLGCGGGELLFLLIKTKQVHAQGIELSEQAIHNCVSAGLSVYQQDIDTGLSEYGNKTVDYVILNQTLQQVKKPDFVIKEALRIGIRVIVGFPNFCYINNRFKIFFSGRVPVSASLPYQWYDTPNLHFLSITDFKAYCLKNQITIEKAAFVTKNQTVSFLPNLFGELGIFLLSK